MLFRSYTTYWATGSTVDRDFFSLVAPIPASQQEVQVIDFFYGGCIEGCPLYSVRLLPDGRAFYLGMREVDPMGGYGGTWDAGRLSGFSSDANQPAFLALQDFYSPTPELGKPSRGLRLHFMGGGDWSSVSVQSCGPPPLEALLGSLDSIVSDVTWTQSILSWDTLDMRSLRWIDLDSLERLSAR